MPKSTKAKQATIEEITSQEDFKAFIAMMEVTGQFEDKTFDDMSTDDQRNVVNKFYLWKEKGSPKAEMPVLKDDKVDEIISLYRTKHRGEQYIWYVTKDGKTVGKDYVHTYAQQEDIDENGKPLGTFHDDLKTITSSEPKYLTPYTKELGEEYLNLAFKYNDLPVFVFEIGGRRFGIDNPHVDFNCDGDRMMDITQEVINSRKGRRV